MLGPAPPHKLVGGWGTSLWRKHKTSICEKVDQKVMVKRGFGHMVVSRAVRKGGIIKGVWLPGSSSPLKRSVKGVKGDAE